jgi:hypothetical protein
MTCPGLLIVLVVVLVLVIDPAEKGSRTSTSRITTSNFAGQRLGSKAETGSSGTARQAGFDGVSL